MDWIAILAEEKIRQAMQQGELDNLPGKGKPLALDDDAGVPEDLRVSYRLMKNAGLVPEEIQLRKDLLTLQELLRCCEQGEERVRLDRELTAKKLRYEQLMADRGWSASTAFLQYEEQIRDKVLGSGDSRSTE